MEKSSDMLSLIVSPLPLIINFVAAASVTPVCSSSSSSSLLTNFNIIITTCGICIGGCQRALKLSDKEIISHHEKGHKCWDENDIMDGKATGLIRISLSYINTFSDCHSFISFLKKYYVDSPPPPSSASNHHSLSISDHHTPLSSLSPSSSSLLLPTAPIVHIKSIVVYPIKSCGGWNVSDWYLTDKGLLFDRGMFYLTSIHSNISA